MNLGIWGVIGGIVILAIILTRSNRSFVRTAGSSLLLFSLFIAALYIYKDFGFDTLFFIVILLGLFVGLVAIFRFLRWLAKHGWTKFKGPWGGWIFKLSIILLVILVILGLAFPGFVADQVARLGRTVQGTIASIRIFGETYVIPALETGRDWLINKISQLRGNKPQARPTQARPEPTAIPFQIDGKNFCPATAKIRTQARAQPELRGSIRGVLAKGTEVELIGANTGLVWFIGAFTSSQGKEEQGWIRSSDLEFELACVQKLPKTSDKR